jgi:hypothetical protein
MSQIDQETLLPKRKRHPSNQLLSSVPKIDFEGILSALISSFGPFYNAIDTAPLTHINTCIREAVKIFPLTRARYCLWILGNERALASNDNVWKSLVLDSKNRGFFFHADRDTEMAKAIFDSIKELDRWIDLLDTSSVIFRNTMWKVYYRCCYKLHT